MPIFWLGSLSNGDNCETSADLGDAINTAYRNKSEIPWDIFGVKTVGCMFARDATLFIGQRQWQKPQRQMPKRDKLFWLSFARR